MVASLTRAAMRNHVSVEDVSDGALDDMIADVEAMAVTLAPCLQEELNEHHARAAVAVMRGAVLRWVEYYSGDTTFISAGPYSQSTTVPERKRGDLLWPSEISRLQEICRAHRGESERQAYTIERLAANGIRHTPYCDIYFNPARGCSCGASLTGSEPLWGD